VLLALATGAGSLLLGLCRDAFVPAVLAFLIGFLVVLAIWPRSKPPPRSRLIRTGAAASYGVTNQVETRCERVGPARTVAV